MNAARIRTAALLCAAVLCMPLAACGKNNESNHAQAADLTKDIKVQSVTGTDADERFCAGQTAFALHLLQETLRTDEKNVLISPYSVTQALAMTANGAKGNTLAQMEQVFGSIPVSDLNRYLLNQRNGQQPDDSCKLLTANSVWFRDAKTLTVQQDFLQNAADYYGADIYKAAFDDSTLKDINSWADSKTDHMIPQVLDAIPEDAVMYLVNAVTFDAKWADPYRGDQYTVEFTALNGRTQMADMMFFDEYTYLSDDRAVGFMKPYEGGRYAFAALMPEEGLSVIDYAVTLTPESLRGTLADKQDGSVRVGLPKFSVSYDAELSPMLKSMGMTDVFDSAAADLSGAAVSENGKINVSRVVHKTRIDVDAEGTRAGAVTAVEAVASGMAEETKFVTLSRPFLYMIVDTETDLPVFMGVLTELNE